MTKSYLCVFVFDFCFIITVIVVELDGFVPFWVVYVLTNGVVSIHLPEMMCVEFWFVGLSVRGSFFMDILGTAFNGRCFSGQECCFVYRCLWFCGCFLEVCWYCVPSALKHLLCLVVLVPLSLFFYIALFVLGFIVVVCFVCLCVCFVWYCLVLGYIFSV